jgi:hypothetical protein
MEAESKLRPETWVYIGQRTGYSGKLQHHFLPVHDDDGLSQSPMVFDVKRKTALDNLRAFYPGAMYEVETGERTTKFGKYDPVGKWPSETDRIKWNTMHYGATRDAAAAREMKRELEGVLEDQLAPIREAMRNMPARQRAQVLARIVYILTH